MSRTKHPNPHVSAFITIQPKKNYVPDQHYVFRTPEMIKEYSYNKRLRYDVNGNARADDHNSSLGFMPLLQGSFPNTYTKDEWTWLQTRRQHLGTNVTDDSWSSFMPFQVRHYVPEALAATDEGDIICNGKQLMIGGQGPDTRSYPNKGIGPGGGGGGVEGPEAAAAQQHTWQQQQHHSSIPGSSSNLLAQHSSGFQWQPPSATSGFWLLILWLRVPTR